jgi:hypothetical protein
VRLITVSILLTGSKNASIAVSDPWAVLPASDGRDGEEHELATDLAALIEAAVESVGTMANCLKAKDQPTPPQGDE